jgi:hypothetical protein
MTLYRAKSYCGPIQNPKDLLFSLNDMAMLECQSLSLIELNKMFGVNEYYFGFPPMTGDSINRIREKGFTILYFDRNRTIWWIIIDIDHKDLTHLKRDLKLQEILSI